MKRTFLMAAAAAALFCSSAAFAAPFTGPYVGLTAGYDSTTSSNNDLTPTNAHADGFTGGFEGGYNVAVYDNIVLGAAADLDIGSQVGHKSMLVCPASTCGFDVSQTTAARETIGGSVRALAGATFFDGKVLAYGTGGIAFGDTTRGDTDSYGGAFPSSSVSTHSFGIGWTAGAGVKVALDDKWSVGAEYRHTDLDTGRTSYANGPFSASYSASLKSDAVLATVDYSVN